MDNSKNELKAQENIHRFRMFGKSVSRKSFLSLVATEELRVHFGQSAEDSVLLRLFNKKEKGFYLDVGAFHPRKYSNTYLLHKYYGWSGINVDASKETIEKFEAERPGDLNLHTAVGGTTEKETTYWKFKHPARNTISKENVDRQLSKGDTEIVEEEKVPMRTLESIIKEFLPADQSIDLLNVDVEGVDLEVLKSNDWKKYRPKAILIEDYSVLSEGLEASEIHAFLKKTGYKFFSHNFDTSLYIEKDFNPNIQPEKEESGKNQYIENALLSDPAVYERALSLSDAHPDTKKAKDKLATTEKRLKEEISKKAALQAEMEKAEAVRKELRHDLQNEKDRVSNSYQVELKLRDQLDAAQAEAKQSTDLIVQNADLKAELRLINEQLKGLQAEAKQAKKLAGQNADLKAELQRTQEQINTLQAESEQAKKLVEENAGMKAELQVANETLNLRNERIEDYTAANRTLTDLNEQLRQELLTEKEVREQAVLEELRLTDKLVRVQNELKNEYKKNEAYLEELYSLKHELDELHEDMHYAFLFKDKKAEDKEKQWQEEQKKYKKQQQTNKELANKIKQKENQAKKLDQQYDRSLKERNRYKRQFLLIQKSNSWRYTLPIRKAADYLKGANYEKRRK